jgi:type IV pilus assembly protein PilY1
VNIRAVAGQEKEVKVMNIKARFQAIITGAALAVYAAAPAFAEDIEIYTKASLGSTFIQPNVMFIMDSSGSMNSNLSVPAVYDHTVTYTGCYDGTKLYYTNSGAKPDCASRDYFEKASNKCDASENEYDLGVIIDPLGPLEQYGFYADQLAQYNSKKNIWQGMSAKNAAERAYSVECFTDSGVHGETGPSNPYIKDSGPWTSTVPANPSAPHLVWADGANGLTIYDGNYLNYTIDPSVGATTMSRFDIAKGAVEAIVTANNNINIGLMRFDEAIGKGGYEGGAVMYPALDVKASRGDFKSRLKTMTADGYTPLAETYYEALMYFGGKEIVYGDDAVPSNQTGTKETGNPTHYETPITKECQKNYIVYLTDGAPTRDYLDATKRGVLPGFDTGSCNTDPDPDVWSDWIQYNEDAFSSAASSRDHCLDELAGWARNNDVAERSFSAHDGTQLITTYTVGFDFSSSPSTVDAAALKLLQDTATAGGGKFFEAKSKDSLLGVFNQILAEILAVNSTFSSPAVSVNAYNRATNLDDLYFSLFKPASGAHWDGNLKKYKLGTTVDGSGDTVPEIQDANGDPAVNPATGFFYDTTVSYWTPAADSPDGAETAVGGAASKLTLSRNAYTFTGTYPDFSVTGVAVPGGSDGDLTTTANALSKTNTNITDAMMGGIVGNPDVNYYDGGVKTMAYTDAVLDWAYGYDILDRDGETDLDSMEPRRLIGDPLHAEPALVQYGETGAGDPDLVAYVATNDGYLHAVNSLTGLEYWAFVPQEMLSNLAYIFEDAPVAGKSYGLDGNVVPWINDTNGDGDIDSGEHVYLYFGQRRGGSDIFSMDVTDRTNPKLRWVIKGGSGKYAELGQTWSTPNVERLRLGGAVKNVLIFGGGYDTGQDTVTVRTPDAVGRSVFIVDAETGALLWRAGPDGGADLILPEMKYSIPGRIKPVDVDSNGYVDQLYFGDMGGQLWRIDIEESETSSSLPGLITGGRIADFALDSSTQDVRRFYYPPDVALIIESGQSPYLSIVAASGYRAHPLDKNIRDRMYMMRMDAIYDAPTSYTTITEADLFDTTDNIIGEGTDSEKAAAVTSLGSAKGWFISFNELDGSWIGEKALAEPLILGGVALATTYVPEDLDPTSSSCVPKAGTGIIYYVNVTDGTPTFNISGTVEKTREDRKEFLKRGGIPPSPTVIITEGGTPTLCIGTECGAASFGLDIQKMYWYEIEQ